MSRSRRAFTSIELLVVLGVVSILTAIAAPGVMASLRRNAVAGAVNAVVGLTEEARMLAVSTSPPVSADPTWSEDDRFGVVIHRRDDDRYSVAITRGPEAREDTIWHDNRRGQAREIVLPAGVVVASAETLGDDPEPVDVAIGWTLAYRTGSTVTGSGATLQRPSTVGVVGSPVAERLVVRSRDGLLEAVLEIHPVGLAYGSEVREP